MPDKKRERLTDYTDAGIYSQALRRAARSDRAARASGESMGRQRFQDTLGPWNSSRAAAQKVGTILLRRFGLLLFLAIMIRLLFIE